MQNTKADKTGTRNKVTTKTAWQSNNLKARQSTKKKIKVQIKHQKPEIKIQRTHTIQEEQGQEHGQEHGQEPEQEYGQERKQKTENNDRAMSEGNTEAKYTDTNDMTRNR